MNLFGVHLGFIVLHQVQARLISQVRNECVLLCRNLGLHPCLLLNFLEIYSVVPFETIFVLPNLPKRCEVIDLGDFRLRHPVDHLLDCTARPRSRILLLFLRLFSHHVLSRSRCGLVCLFYMALMVCNRDTREQHHVSFVVRW